MQHINMHIICCIHYVRSTRELGLRCEVKGELGLRLLVKGLEFEPCPRCQLFYGIFLSVTGISVVVVKLLVCDRLGPPRKGLTLNPDSLGLKQAFEFISEEIELFAFICFRIRNTENPAIIMTFHGYRLDSACLRSYFQLLNRSNF